MSFRAVLPFLALSIFCALASRKPQEPPRPQPPSTPPAPVTEPKIPRNFLEGTWLSDQGAFVIPKERDSEHRGIFLPFGRPFAFFRPPTGGARQLTLSTSSTTGDRPARELQGTSHEDGAAHPLSLDEARFTETGK